MLISPINFQSNTPIRQSEFPSFQGNAKIQETITRTVRNKRTYYPAGQQPTWKDLLEQFTKGFAKKKTEKYFGFCDKSNVCSKTSYFNEQGDVMAITYHIPSGKYAHSTLHTPTKDYYDWGNTGIVHCYDEDQKITITPKQGSSLEKKLTELSNLLSKRP